MSYYPGLKAALATLTTNVGTAQTTANNAAAAVASAISAATTISVPERMLTLILPGEANAGTVLGATGAIATGTLTTPSPANTNLITQRRRLLYTSANAASRYGGIRAATTGDKVRRGDVAGHGGFRFRAVFGTTSATATQQLIVGLLASGANPFVDTVAAVPSNFTDCVFVGYDGAGTQLVMMHNDGASTCTQVVLNGGTGFPVDNSSLYQITITAAPNASTIEYELVNIGTGLTVTGSLSTNLPTNTVNMLPAAGAGTSTGGGIALFNLGSLILQTYSY